MDETAPACTCTFGTYNQSTPWTDVRTLPWAELAELLTRHVVGPKEGACIVPATFTGSRRTQADAERIDVAFLDSDAGATLTEITAAVRARGWSAVVSSTHSHLSTRTRLKREPWEAFCLSVRDAADAAERYLLSERAFLPRVANGARVVAEDAEHVWFEHEPCPKFRVALPLRQPWLANDYEDQRRANAAWKGRIEALAAALALSHDQACTDTSRLFYLPRRPADGPAAETEILLGSPCDIFALPKAAPTSTSGSRRRRDAHAGGRQGQLEQQVGDDASYTDPTTGQTIQLTEWAKQFAPRFEIAQALGARRPDIFTPRAGEGIKRHIRCVNENAHTQGGADAATFVVDASASTNQRFVYHCRHAHCTSISRLVFLKQMLERGWLGIADLIDADFLSAAEERPTIRLVGGEISAMVDQAEAALLKANVSIFQRGMFVVRPGMVRVAVGNGRKVFAERILEVGEHALVEAFTSAADWERFDGRSQRWVRIDAPQKVAAIYKERVGRWRLPILVGLINAPTLRADGSVLDTDGYDQASGLLLRTSRTAFPTLSDHPTKDDAVSALGVLTGLLQGFPFVRPADRAVALSSMLTACIRKSLSTAPLHAFSAPVPGSGKSKLVDIATIMASGREAAVIAQGKNEQEFEKRLGSQLLAGDAVIAIDNCESPLGGEVLCQMLTQPVIRTRILGRSEMPELPADAMVTATGNNLVLVGDMVRRAVLCQLDPRCERPELRVFADDPVQLVQADRGRYVVAALTVLRAFEVAGRPRQRDPLGSFIDWSARVRDALIWLGEADPVDTLEAIRAHDPKLDAFTAVVTQWREVIGGDRVSTQALIYHATAQTDAESDDHAHLVPKHPLLHEALLRVASDDGAISSRRLSKWISGNENRIVAGFRIVRKGMLRGFMTWSVQVEEAVPDAE